MTTLGKPTLILGIPPGTVVLKPFHQYIYKISHAVIPDSITVIGRNAFSTCSNLQRLIIPPGVIEIGVCAFDGCSSLQTLVIPDGVTTIGECAFYRCSSLKTMIIPASVTKLGRYSISGCSGLERTWNKSKCDLDDYDPDDCYRWVHLRGETPLLKDLEKWTFALHWHWRYPDRITPVQARLFTTGLHCLAVPTELCQTVFSYIPRA
jgi:hypothetical protein